MCVFCAHAFAQNNACSVVACISSSFPLIAEHPTNFVLIQVVVFKREGRGARSSTARDPSGLPTSTGTSYTVVLLSESPCIFKYSWIIIDLVLRVNIFK